MRKILILLIIISFIPLMTLAQEETENLPILDIVEAETITDEAQAELSEIPVQSFEGYLEYNDVQEEPETEKNAVFLNTDDRKIINLSRPQDFSYQPSNLNKKNKFDVFSSNLEPASKFSTQEYLISPMSQSIAKKNGNFSFGTSYNSYIDSAEINYSTSLFTRYDSKKFALTTSFSKNTRSSYANYTDKVFFIPELKLTKRLSLLDVMQSDTDMIRQKNEIVLRYTPKFKNNYEDMQFEIGAGQSFFENEFVKSSLRFSTKFKL